MKYIIEKFNYSDQHFAALLDLSNALLPPQWRHWNDLPMLKFDIYQIPAKANHEIELIKVHDQFIGYGVTRFNPYAYDPSELDTELLLPNDHSYHELALGYVKDQINYAKAIPGVSQLRVWQNQRTKWGQKVYPALGFKETMVENATLLKAENLISASFQAKLEKFYQTGFDIITLEQYSNSNSDWKEKFYDLYMKVDNDVPTDNAKNTDISLATWHELVFHPWQSKADIFIAMEGKKMIGLCYYDRSPNLTTTVYNALAGVLPEYRRKYVGSALKFHSISQLINNGIDTIIAENENRNPMYQVNLSMGYKKVHEELSSRLIF